MRVSAGARGADVLARDQFRVKSGETVLITADTASDAEAVEAVFDAAVAARARPSLMVIPQLPFQGKLADPYVPDTLAAGALHSDVWFDLTFPYLAGSEVHDNAMRNERTRYLLLGDLSIGGLHRLYGTIELDSLYAVQKAFDDLTAAHEGAHCRVTSPSGTDVEFTLGKSVGSKPRHCEKPGMSTPLGSSIFFPVPETVVGQIALDAVFHEYYVMLSSPMTLTVDKEIIEVRNGFGQTRAMDRALRRANKGKYGRVIHFSYGFHPSARFSGRSFIEDIRACGTNAIGLGMPWWEPGGGENHPDAVVSQQSLWIDGEQILHEGGVVGPQDLADRARSLQT